ncbi:hypothetical protein HDV03_000919 [Kappamyces sp. JEL0829]|nr:hypothetical protein HDV03_000919 [Kappamyces sp. JEL0829]
MLDDVGSNDSGDYDESDMDDEGFSEEGYSSEEQYSSDLGDNGQAQSQPSSPGSPPEDDQDDEDAVKSEIKMAYEQAKTMVENYQDLFEEMPHSQQLATKEESSSLEQVSDSDGNQSEELEVRPSETESQPSESDGPHENSPVLDGKEPSDVKTATQDEMGRADSGFVSNQVVGGQNLYKIHCILEKRTNQDGSIEYLTQYKDQSKEEATWEPYCEGDDNWKDDLHIIAAFEESLKAPRLGELAADTDCADEQLANPEAAQPVDSNATTAKFIAPAFTADIEGRQSPLGLDPTYSSSDQFQGNSASIALDEMDEESSLTPVPENLSSDQSFDFNESHELEIQMAYERTNQTISAPKPLLVKPKDMPKQGISSAVSVIQDSCPDIPHTSSVTPRALASHSRNNSHVTPVNLTLPTIVGIGESVKRRRSTAKAVVRDNNGIPIVQRSSGRKRL